MRRPSMPIGTLPLAKLLSALFALLCASNSRGRVALWVAVGLTSGVLIASTAHAFWAISEVYSNTDGSVQFILLSTSSSGDRAIAGRSIVVTGASSHNSFMFPNDLPGDSAYRSLLVGTQGFADLGVIRPDFVVPNGFLLLPAGRVSLGI